MTSIRPLRHAHTEGLTRCAVVIPARRKRRSTGKLKSGLSTPRKRSGPSPSCWTINCRRMLNSSGKRFNGSTKPMTDSRSMGHSDCNPAACSRLPPIPVSFRWLPRLAHASMTAPANRSPDISPAQMPIREGCSVTNGRCRAGTSAASRSIFVRSVFR